MFLCLWRPEWHDDLPFSAQAHLLEVVPRVVARGDIVWADVRGLPVRATVEHIAQILTERGERMPRIGVAATPIAAEVAARYAPQQVTYVGADTDRAFLAPFPIEVLRPDHQLTNLLDGVGIERCGDLARLSREAVEVRFGSAGARLWALARADDTRRIFTHMPRTLPEASLEWSEYTVRRAERLLFVINALAANACETLQARGEGAVSLTLYFVLANRTTYAHTLRAARPTASHTAWMRLIRLALESIALPDGVTGITVRVDTIAALGDKQGDMFDRGFTTARAAEEALAQLLDDQGAVVVVPDNTLHPLIDRRTDWVSLSAARVIEKDADAPSVADSGVSPMLTLQVVPQPIRINVATVMRREKAIPHRYRDRNTVYTLTDVAGPDCVVGGTWERAYEREYYRCVTEQGVLVWIYRDVRLNAWYLHGWWD